MASDLQQLNEWTLVAQENDIKDTTDKLSAWIYNVVGDSKVQGVSSAKLVF